MTGGAGNIRDAQNRLNANRSMRASKKGKFKSHSHDLIYKTEREKFNAVIDDIVSLTAQGRPVLVGTTSVEISEKLSRILNMKGIKHNVLNAKQHQREADIVAACF